MMWASAFVAVVLAVIAGGAELIPTGVANVPLRTQPPEEVSRPQYAQTLYKATDHVVSELHFTSTQSPRENDAILVVMQAHMWTLVD